MRLVRYVMPAGSRAARKDPLKRGTGLQMIEPPRSRDPLFHRFARALAYHAFTAILASGVFIFTLAIK